MSEDFRPAPAEDTATLLLHTLTGEPLLLRRKFMISALNAPEFADEDDELETATEVIMDEGPYMETYIVKENVTDIPGPFARLDNLLINPAYFLKVQRLPDTGTYNEDEEGNDESTEDVDGGEPIFNWLISMRGPSQKTYYSTFSPTVVSKALAGVKAPAP